jgi:hypothetical protein
MILKQLHQLFLKRIVKLRRSVDKHLFDWFFNRQTISQHELILTKAESDLKNKDKLEDPESYLDSTDPLAQQGARLKKETENLFKNCLAKNNLERILIHIPSAQFSPAGYSLFSNLLESLNFIGVDAEALVWDADIREALDRFKPTVLLTSDNKEYLSRINWDAITHFRVKNALKIGLSAALEEYESTPLLPRLSWAKQQGVDFFYSYRDRDYVFSRKEYQPFFDAGFHILFIPFGANILHYYPVPGLEKSLDYVLMASRKREHIEYLKNITRNYIGFIDGPGWKQIKSFKFYRDRDRYIYSRAKVGLNIHLPEQLEWACELNERTYQLAACGVPQLIDHPLLLNTVFGEKSFFIADTPRQYDELFKELVNNPAMGEEKALCAQKEVFALHTTFHRAKSLADQLAKLI